MTPTPKRKAIDMTEIINLLARELEAALAQGMTRDEARNRAEVAVRMEYGGERVYIASHPKRARAVQLARLELRTTREIAVATGLTIRRVQQLRRG